MAKKKVKWWQALGLVGAGVGAAYLLWPKDATSLIDASAKTNGNGDSAPPKAKKKKKDAKATQEDIEMLQLEEDMAWEFDDNEDLFGDAEDDIFEAIEASDSEMFMRAYNDMVLWEWNVRDALDVLDEAGSEDSALERRGLDLLTTIYGQRVAAQNHELYDQRFIDPKVAMFLAERKG